MLLENQSKNDHTGSNPRQNITGFCLQDWNKEKMFAFWFHLRWCLASVVHLLCTRIRVVQEKEKRPCACCTASELEFYTSIRCTTNPLSNLSIWSGRGKEAVARVPLEQRRKRRSNSHFLNPIFGLCQEWNFDELCIQKTFFLRSWNRCRRKRRGALYAQTKCIWNFPIVLEYFVVRCEYGGWILRMFGLHSGDVSIHPDAKNNKRLQPHCDHRYHHFSLSLYVSRRYFW